MGAINAERYISEDRTKTWQREKEQSSGIISSVPEANPLSVYVVYYYAQAADLMRGLNRGALGQPYINQTQSKRSIHHNPFISQRCSSLFQT